MNALEIHDNMLRSLAESAPSYATITCWIRKFKCGRESVKDDQKLCCQIPKRLGISIE